MSPKEKVLAVFPGATVEWTDCDFAPCIIQSASGEILGNASNEQRAWIDASALTVVQEKFPGLP